MPKQKTVGKSKLPIINDSYDIHVEGENGTVSTISWNPVATGNFANPTLAEIIAAAKKEFPGIPFKHLIVVVKGDGFVELSTDPLKDIL